jgi:hypothetical protein
MLTKHRIVQLLCLTLISTLASAAFPARASAARLGCTVCVPICPGDPGTDCSNEGCPGNGPMCFEASCGGYSFTILCNPI